MVAKVRRKAFWHGVHNSWAIAAANGVVALIDADVIETVERYCWSACKHGRRLVMMTTKGLLMHRVIMGAKRGEHVDHIRHYEHDDMLIDNRRANLRICTRKENMANQRRQIGKTSAYKGVYWDKPNNKWRAKITEDNKTYCLGRYKDEIDAARAYNTAARERFGEYARLNKVD